jgi:O-antigen/teichoic acid export membrane protein
MNSRGSGFRRDASYLGVAGMLEYSLQLILPVILVRYLDVESFAQYRMIWLLAATMLAIAPLYMPQALFHFLPTAGSRERSAYICNTVVFLALMSLSVAVALLWFRGLLPASMQVIRDYPTPVAAFVGLWVLGSLMDVLPTADNRARWQATAVIAIAAIRTTLVGVVAVATSDVRLVILALIVVAVSKVLMIAAYGKQTSVRVVTETARFSEQWKYVLPFALGNALFLLRIQTDQWLVAAYFSAKVFALVSIAAVVVAISNLVRLPINNALMPRVGVLIAEQNMRGVESTLARGYITISYLLVPFLGAAIACANEVVEIIYTVDYVAAAPVMQVYLIGQVAGIFAAGHLMIVAGKGSLAASISGVSLLLSVALSLVGIELFGYIGAAAGSVTAMFVGEYFALRVVAKAFQTTPGRLVAVTESLRVVSAVAVATIGSLVVRSSLLVSMDVYARLAAEAMVFVVLGGMAAAALGLHKTAIASFRQR